MKKLHRSWFLLVMSVLLSGFVVACGDDEEDDGGGGNNTQNNTANNTVNNTTNNSNNTVNNTTNNSNNTVNNTNNTVNNTNNVVVDPLCQEYCDAVFAACTGANAQYTTPDDCLAQCVDLPKDGEEGDTDGNTVQCRIYHAGAAAADPATHCPHAGFSGAGVCVDAEPDPVEVCQAACVTLGETCGPNFAEICPAEVVGQIVPGCQEACNSPEAQAQIIQAANLPCDIVVPLAIEGFGLGEVCGGEETTLYERLGGNEGITSAIQDFVGRVVADPKINGYFLNMDLDGGNLVSCLVKQVGSLTGGPEVYDCRGMVESHAGLGISQADYDDLAGHLVAELMERGVSEEDIGVIATVLTAPDFVAQIVENPAGNETLYHRLGRKPGIEGAIDGFLAEVTADARINGAFANANVPRLRTCLVRQVCEVAGGPCKYGLEVEAEVIGEDGLGSPCKDMASSHAGLGITKADFDALVEDLVTVLTEAGVPEADIGLIGGALGPLCPDIVEGGTGCTE